MAENVVYGNSIRQTADVGNRSDGASWIGAEDMSGNVGEWVSSLYLPYRYDPTKAENLEDTNSSRVARGGSWFFDQLRLRTFVRVKNPPSYEDNGYGFRCARSALP